MEFIRFNTNELIVKIFYLLSISVFTIAYYQMLVGTYQIENYMLIFITVNLLAFYTVLYSVYFIIKHRKEEERYKVMYLKTSRKFSLIFSLMYIILSFTKFNNNKIEFIAMELMFVFILLFAGFLISHMNTINYYYNKRIIWMER